VLVNSCDSTNFFAMDQNAFKLMEKFCECPQAKNLIKLQTIPLGVTVGDFSLPTTVSDGVRKRSLEDVFIYIPKSSTDKKKVTELAFELFNSIGLKNIIDIHVRANTLSMDLFAREVELQEQRLHKGYLQLLQNCQKKWRVDQEVIDTEKALQMLNDEDKLIAEDIACHTDTYRLQWINLYQPDYCKDHQEDLRSCSAKPEQLCHADKMQQMPEEQAEQIRLQRLCALFSKFSEHAKKLFTPKVKQICPKVLSGKRMEL
jgi:hypothetical protein